MTQDPSLRDQRTDDFTEYVLADKSYWLHQALQQFSGTPEEQKIRNYAKELEIDPDARAARRHWSGKSGFVWEVTLGDHPLDGPTTEQHKKASYAVDYFQTSSFVHCSQPGLDNYFPEGSAFRVSVSSGKYKRPSQSTLFSVLVYLHSTTAYALFGMNLDRPARLDTLFQETLQKMAAIQRLHP